MRQSAVRSHEDLTEYRLSINGEVQRKGAFTLSELESTFLRVEREQPMYCVNSWRIDRKSTRLNSSHLGISYAVFCLKKKEYDFLLEALPASVDPELLGGLLVKIA